MVVEQGLTFRNSRKVGIAAICTSDIKIKTGSFALLLLLLSIIIINI